MSGRKKLDILFVLGTTGVHLETVSAIIASCKTSFQSHDSLRPNDGLRVGLMAFRKYYSKEDFGGFKGDVEELTKNLPNLVSSGDGDGKEAVASVLDKALKFDWRSDAAKVVVLFTDAPSHEEDYNNLLLEMILTSFPFDPPESYTPSITTAKDLYIVGKALASASTSLLLFTTPPTSDGGKAAASYLWTRRIYAAFAKLASGEVHEMTPDANKLTHFVTGFTTVKIASLPDPGPSEPTAGNAKPPPRRETIDNSPAYPIEIDLKNVSDGHINISYRLSGSTNADDWQTKLLVPSGRDVVKFLVNRHYEFKFKSGNRKGTYGRAFDREEAWEVSRYIDW